MASSQADLRKIGLEGFALIDKYYGPTRNDAFSGRREGFWVVHQVPNGDKEKPGLKAKDFVGIAVPNHSSRGGKFLNRSGRPIKHN